MNVNSRGYIAKEALGSGVVNGLINGAFAWYLSRDKEQLLVWGEKGMVVDFLFTALILVFLLSLIVLLLQRRKFAKASTVVQPPFAFIRYLGWAAGYRDSVKSLLLALTAVVASLPLLWLVFSLMGAQSYSPYEFTVLKSVYTGLLSVAVVPVVILFAMHPVRRIKEKKEGELV